MTIWLTRPEADSIALAGALGAAGIDTLIAPVVRIAPRAVTLTEKPDAILLTSRHAAHALPAEWRDLPVFCVGMATADAARAHGYSAITHGTSDALHLLPHITAHMSAGQRLLYLSGEDTRHDISRLLAANDIAVTREVAYEAISETTFPPALREALANHSISGVVFFSPRSAMLACGLLKQEEFTASAPTLDAYCLSLPVAEAAGELPWRSLHVCHLPNREAMLAMVVAHAQAVAS